MSDIIFEHDRLFDAAYTPHAASGMYAIIFNRQNQALRTNVTPMILDAFSSSLQSNFATVLTEHSERTGHYQGLISEGDYELPDNGYGEEYTIEVWCKEVSGGSFDRSADKLITTKKLMLFGGEVAHTIIPRSQESRSHEVLLGIGWDHQESLLTLNCFLEINGELVTEPQSATVSIVTEEGDEILSINMGTPLSNGVFFNTVAGLTLTPDTVYFATVTITDNEGVARTGGASPITWD